MTPPRIAFLGPPAGPEERPRGQAAAQDTTTHGPDERHTQPPTANPSHLEQLLIRVIWSNTRSLGPSPRPAIVSARAICETWPSPAAAAASRVRPPPGPGHPAPRATFSTPAMQ